MIHLFVKFEGDKEEMLDDSRLCLLSFAIFCKINSNVLQTLLHGKLGRFLSLALSLNIVWMIEGVYYIDLLLIQVDSTTVLQK